MEQAGSNPEGAMLLNAAGAFHSRELDHAFLCLSAVSLAAAALRSLAWRSRSFAVGTGQPLDRNEL